MKEPTIPERKMQLMADLSLLGIKTVLVSYSGGGDSGQVDKVVALPYKLDTGAFSTSLADGQPIDLTALVCDSDTAKALAVKRRLLTNKAETLERLIEAFCYDALEFISAPDWYNNDGGDGTMKIDVENELVTFRHFTNVVSQEEHDLGEL